jgi:hypothetical protein
MGRRFSPGTDWTEVTATATAVLVAVTAALAVTAIAAEALTQGRDWAAMGSRHPFAASARATGIAQPQ